MQLAEHWCSCRLALEHQDQVIRLVGPQPPTQQPGSHGSSTSADIVANMLCTSGRDSRESRHGCRPSSSSPFPHHHGDRNQVRSTSCSAPLSAHHLGGGSSYLPLSMYFLASCVLPLSLKTATKHAPAISRMHLSCLRHIYIYLYIYTYSIP